MVSSEFINAINENNELRVHIILKDSLLVDKSFRQFNEMVEYADRHNYNVWKNGDDPSPLILSEKAVDRDVLNEELTMLVDDFTHERVRRIQAIIKKLYTPVQPQVKKDSYQGKTNHEMDYKTIQRASRGIREKVNQSKENGIWLTEDILIIGEYAKQIEEATNHILKGD